MTRSVVHATFTVERVHDHAPARVFEAFANPAAKRRWFAEGEGWDVESYDLDFRVGGAERCRMRFNNGPIITNDTVFQDIVPNERIIIAYHMTIGGNPISASLSTIEFKPKGAGTRLVFTEHDAFLDGYDGLKDREEGTRGLLEALDQELNRK